MAATSLIAYIQCASQTSLTLFCENKFEACPCQTS